MKPVLHVVPSVAARDGGPSMAVAGMCRALAAEGVSTLVVTTNADGAGHLDVPLNEPTTFGGMNVRFFPCQFSERLKFSGPLAAWVRAHVGEFSAVHVHAVFSHASIAAGRAARRAGKAYIVRPLGSIDPWSLAHHHGRKRALMWLGARHLLSGAARLHYTADEEQRRAESALTWLPPGIVIPLGVDECFFVDDSNDTNRWQGPAVVLARLDPKKGIDVAIRAFHELAPALSERRLIIAGDGDAGYVRELRRLAADGPAARHIEFAGWLDGPDRLRLLGSASLFVLPSAQENFGLSMVEAMAAGTPVVATRTMDLAPRVEREQAGWIVSRSTAGVVEALTDSLSNPTESRRRGARARRLAETYRWNRVAGQLKALYAELTTAAASAASRPVAMSSFVPR